MQRVPVFLILALIFVGLYYLTPLREYMQSHYDKGSSSTSRQTSSTKEEGFDKVSLELLVISNKVANLEGKVRILKMAQEHPDWLSGEEYSHLATVITRTEEDLNKAQEEYERVKNEYARETAAKIIRESLAADSAITEGSGSETEESLPLQY